MKTKTILSLFLICLSFPVISQEIIKQETTTTTTTTSTSINPNTNVINNNNTVTETPTPPKKKAKIWIGPKFGVDVNSMSLSKVDVSKELDKNYQFGLLVKYGRTFYIQPEVYYASYKSTAVTAATPSTSRNYIKIPVQVGVEFLDLGLFSLHITTGPSYSIKLDDKDQITDEKGFSWLVGAGVDVLGFITSDIRYSFRNKVSLSDQISQFNTYPNVLSLTVGLKLR